MSWATKYIGARFEDHGRGPAYDCWGLVQTVLRDDFGIDVPGYDDQYTDILDRNVVRLFEQEANAWKSVEREVPGDVALFRIHTRPWHVGIVVERGLMLHITKGIDAAVERYNNPFWRPKLVGFFRHAD